MNGISDLRGRIANLARNASTRTAIVGDGSGNVVVVGRPNYIFARVGDAGGEVVQVHCGILMPSDGDAVLVARDTGGDSAQWRIVLLLG